MLKPLTYQYHTISKFQTFVNYLFLEVVFNNQILRDNAAFNINLVLQKYRDIVNVKSDYLHDPLVEIFKICKDLSSKDLKILRKAVHSNNQIESLCSGDLNPITYRDLNDISIELSIELRKLFGKLYKYVIDLQPVYSRYGKKNDFYKGIVGIETVCHCCGVGTMLNVHQGPVGALDHYFSIKHYPFSAVNFKNLVPICDICNSKYKTQKDTLYKIKAKIKSGVKRFTIKKYKSFYPYSSSYQLVDVSITIGTTDLNNLEKKDITIEYSVVNHDEEVLNWQRLFDVSEIHKANLLSNESRVFINQQFDTIKALNLDFNQYYNLVNNNLFYNKNFIRLPYLREFNRIVND